MQAEDRGGKQGGRGAGATPGSCLFIHVSYPEQFAHAGSMLSYYETFSSFWYKFASLVFSALATIAAVVLLFPSKQAMPVPPAGATQTANHIDAVEDTPLLHDSRDPAETDTDRMVQPPKPSAVEVIASNSFTGPTGWAAQIGLVVATVVLWRVLWVHPAGESSSRGCFKIFRLGVGADEESDNRGVDEVRSLYVPPSAAVPCRPRLPRGCVRSPDPQQPASPSLTPLEERFLSSPSNRQASSCSSLSLLQRNRSVKDCRFTKSFSMRRSWLSSAERPSLSTTRRFMEVRLVLRTSSPERRRRADLRLFVNNQPSTLPLGTPFLASSCVPFPACSRLLGLKSAHKTLASTDSRLDLYADHLWRRDRVHSAPDDVLQVGNRRKTAVEVPPVRFLYFLVRLYARD